MLPPGFYPPWSTASVSAGPPPPGYDDGLRRSQASAVGCSGSRDSSPRRPAQRLGGSVHHAHSDHRSLVYPPSSIALAVPVTSTADLSSRGQLRDSGLRASVQQSAPLVSGLSDLRYSDCGSDHVPATSEPDDEVGGSSCSDFGEDEFPPVLSKEPASHSSSGLLEALSMFTDVVKVSEEPQTGLSLADQVLGRIGSTVTQSTVSESPIVQRAIADARRRFLNPSLADASSHDAQASSDRAQLAQPAPVLAPHTSRLPLNGPNWVCSSLRPRCQNLTVSEADKERLGLPKQPLKPALVQDSALQRFEGSAARGLVATGRLDTVLAALATALAGGNSDQSPDPEREHRVIQELLSSLSDCTRFVADAFATQHLNAVLLRRDRYLSQSVLPTTAQAVARSLPVAPPYLFGSAAGQVVQEAASHASNTLALRASLKAVNSARRSAPSGPQRRKAPKFSAPSRRPRGASNASKRGRSSTGRPPASRTGQRSAPPAKGQHPQ